jgi:hypothetical protein
MLECSTPLPDGRVHSRSIGKTAMILVVDASPCAHYDPCTGTTHGALPARFRAPHDVSYAAEQSALVMPERELPCASYVRLFWSS